MGSLPVILTLLRKSSFWKMKGCVLATAAVAGAGVGLLLGSGAGVGAALASMRAMSSCSRRICWAVSALVMVVGFCGVWENS
jgi:hypothetical protein